jgi:hypothetical protein
LPCTLIIEDLSKEKPVYYKDLETFLDRVKNTLREKRYRNAAKLGLKIFEELHRREFDC